MDEQEADRKLLFDLIDELERQGDPTPTRTAALQFLRRWQKLHEETS